LEAKLNRFVKVITPEVSFLNLDPRIKAQVHRLIFAGGHAILCQQEWLMRNASVITQVREVGRRGADRPSAVPQRPKLLDQLREALRSRHYSRRTEQAYVMWVKRFIFFHNVHHPAKMAETEINAFLTHLAIKKKVSASTQNQALSALLFIYRYVLGREIGDLGKVIRARKPKRLPVVMTRDEVKAVLAQLAADKWLMASLMYGAGLRLIECLRLRVQDIDFSRNEILVRDGKGAKDRITMLPESLKASLQDHLKKVKAVYDRDLAGGWGPRLDARRARPQVPQRPEGMALATGLSPRESLAERQEWRGRPPSCGRVTCSKSRQSRCREGWPY